MRLRERQRLYHALGQLLKSGVTFPAAARQLARTAQGPTRKLLATLSAEVESGKTLGEAFGATREASALDMHVVAAVERGGRLDRGFEQLANYYKALAQARAVILQKSAYPLFIAHFGVLLLNAPIVVTHGVSAYLREIAWAFGILYGAALLLWLISRQLVQLAERSALVDKALTSIPLLGNVRRCFALARFCFVYDLQLDAGINVIDAVLGAARASRSGRIAAAIDRIIPELRTGAAVGASLLLSDAFPSEMLRDLQVAESIGGLDRALPRMAGEFQERAVTILSLAAEWGAKLLYVGVLLYLGWRIIRLYMGVMGESTRMLDF
ncbi:MAG TPA: type II secretion system F family protein [Chthoniobacteraceae bacterium]|nr:type II secretion system F family protein [Chthoniobacteraceae bacterium]